MGRPSATRNWAAVVLLGFWAMAWGFWVETAFFGDDLGCWASEEILKTKECHMVSAVGEKALCEKKKDKERNMFLY